MSYASDAKTVALYDLDADGTNLVADPTWDLTDNGDGTWSAAGTAAHVAHFAGGSWTVEREIEITSGEGTILELAGWGETEPVNIQVVIGWDSSQRLFAGWESGAGEDVRILSTASLPIGVAVRVAVAYDAGRLTLCANGRRLAEASSVAGPTGGTAGMTLAVGRRVSTSDPASYAGLGWLRISTARTLAEIVEDWEASFSPPVPTGLTWDELARREDVSAYYVFRGQYRAHEDTPGATVAWSTAYVHDAAGGLIEGRMLEAPGSLVRGIPEVPGAMPERVSTSIVLDNADGELTEMFAGGASTVTAYEGDSVLSLSGKIWQGFVGPDGVAVEQAISPTLVKVGSAQMDENARLTIPLASMDRRVLGPTKKLVTVGAVADGVYVAEGSRYRGNDGEVANTSWGDIEFNDLKSAITESLDATVPFAFGRSPIRLTRITEDGVWWLAYVSLSEPDFSGGPWSLDIGEEARFERDFTDTWYIWSVQISVTRSDGEAQTVWLVGVQFAFQATAGQVENDDLFLTPPEGTGAGLPSGVASTPANIIRQIVTDLSEQGASAIDTTSFDRVDDALPQTGTFGGVIGSNAAIGEILSHIAGPLGISLWMGIDDTLHAMLATGWDIIDRTSAEGELATLGLPEIVEGSFSERDAAVGEIGGPASVVGVDWTSDQTSFFAASRRLPYAPGITRLSLAEEQEARISGAWIYPPASQRALEGVGSRRSFAHRRVSVAASSWLASLELGTMLRLTHPFGAQAGGYSSRLVRLIRSELMTGEDAVRLDLVDMQALEDLKIGKLDSAVNWIFYDPNGDGMTLTFASGSNVVTISPSFKETGSWEGRSLWTFGASDPALRRSWRIIAALSDTQVRVDIPAPASGTVTASAPTAPHIAEWILMNNRVSALSNFRTDYITLADEATGDHSDGSDGYLFMT